jgi:glycine/D-amino acid oxidase-like deaminating enzyme/CRP-like cAMP-binding protein
MGTKNKSRRSQEVECASRIATLRRSWGGSKRLTAVDVGKLAAIAGDFVEEIGRAQPVLAAELRRIERDCRFTRGGLNKLQGLMGRLAVDSNFAIRIPENDEPFWFRCDHPLKSFRSRPALPEAADVVIIGAGLTGASAAYHLRDAVKNQRWRVVVLDKGAPAGEASGRNGGNFELLPENSIGVYDGLARQRLLFLQRCYPKVPREILRTEAGRQASLVLGFALRNRDLLKQIIESERIDCDFSPKGWLYLAHTEKEEQAICDEVTMAAEQGQRMEIWPRLKIRKELGFDRKFIGRFIPGDGTYHPFKFVYGVLKAAVDAGVELYTEVKVDSVESRQDGSQLVRTELGTIAARTVIAATNAFSSRLFPELKKIRPAQSQICITEFAPDRCQGRIVTSEEGPVYFNQPRAGALHGLAPLLLGGGADRSIRNPESRRRSPQIHATLLDLRQRFYPELNKRPLSTEWVGPIAFTPDRLPVIGWLRPGVIIAAGYNGYGGTYTVAAGQAAASTALTGEIPEWLPQDVFSPQRLISDEPMFLGRTESLLRIAASLCAQLRAVDRQITETISYGNSSKRVSRKPNLPDLGVGRPAASLDPERLLALPAFNQFSIAECSDLLGMMVSRQITQGTVLFSAGDPGSTCFVIVHGGVDVIIEVNGRDQLLARLYEGAVFGQVALIEGGARTATCRTQKDSMLLEMDREACERLFAGRSPLAYKVLEMLTHGLIAALRGADRQLLRLTALNRVRWNQPAGIASEADDYVSERLEAVALAAGTSA